LKRRAMKKTFCLAALLVAAATPAFAHPGHGAESFAAGVAHPLYGLDHIAAMIAVGLWSALKGGRTQWVWPATFVGAMLFGGALGMAQVPLPLVDPGILASVVVLGLMTAFAVDVPIAAGATLIAVFGLLHGHAHGTEAADTLAGIEYMAGFALATAALHAAGIAFAQIMQRAALRPLVQLAGAACIALGLLVVLT
jgi:urease accessory protein